MRERHQLENRGLVRKIVLKCIFKTSDGGFEYIDLAQNRDR
jgi:hypothetical protein